MMKGLSAVFTQPKYLAVAVLSAALFFALLAFLTNMVVWGFWELNPFVEPARIVLNVLIAALFGANAAVLLHNSDIRKSAYGGTQMTTLGALAALLTSSCPLCQPFVLLTLGLGGIGALFAGLSALIALFSIALLAISLWKGLQAASGTCKLR